MGLKGKLIYQTDVKCHGDVFHELFSFKPHKSSDVAPEHIQGCAVHQGEIGAVGTILNWDYTLDGEKQVIKTVIEDLNEEKKSITVKALEGSTVLEVFKEYKLSLHVDTHGDDHVVTWTIEYEKLHEDKPNLAAYINWCITITKAIEDHHGAK